MGAHSILQAMAEADHTIEDPDSGGRITVDRSPAILELVTTAVETRLLSDPTRAGQLLCITAKTLSNPCVIAADTAINVSSNTVMTFAEEKDTILLIGVNDASLGLRWQELVNQNVSLS